MEWGSEVRSEWGGDGEGGQRLMMREGKAKNKK